MEESSLLCNPDQLPELISTVFGTLLSGCHDSPSLRDPEWETRGLSFAFLWTELVSSRLDRGTIRRGSGTFLYLIPLYRVFLLIMTPCLVICILTGLKEAGLKVKVKMFEILQYNVLK